MLTLLPLVVVLLYASSDIEYSRLAVAVALLISFIYCMIMDLLIMGYVATALRLLYDKVKD